MLVSRTLKSTDGMHGLLRGARCFWRPFIMVLLVVSCLWGTSLGSRVLAQSNLFTFTSKSAGTVWQCRPAGDVNRDGFDDILILGMAAGGRGYLVQIFSGRDGRLLWAHKSTSGWVQDLTGVGDLDRDGYADVVLAVANVAAKRVELWFFSGKTGKKFRTVHVKSSNILSSQISLARGGDVNADGYPDLLLGDAFSGGVGRAGVISGKDGSLIHDLKPTQSADRSFGYPMVAAGDPDEDGYADFFVLASGINTGPVVYVYSGKTGLVMRTFASTTQRFMGYTVHPLGDINRDGRRDYAITGRERLSRPYSPWRSFVEIRSGAKRDKHKVLLTIQEPVALAGSLYMRVAMVGDINKDGLPDLAVSMIGRRPGGWIEYRSGKDGKVLRIIPAPGQNLMIGYQIGSLGDVNGDGMPDIYSETLSGGRPSTKLKIFVYSGGPMDLWSDTHRVSLAKRGKQVLQLDAGPKHAGSGYFVLGSLSGVKPGLKLGGLTLPLQLDMWFWLTASYPNSTFLQRSVGVLDNKGQATCTLMAIPTLPTALIGARADHAYVLFKNGRFTKTSYWVPLLFER